MINEILRPVKIGNSGLNHDELRKQRETLPLYENEHLEDKVVSDPYEVTTKMRWSDKIEHINAKSGSDGRYEVVGKEMEYYLNHIPLKDVDYCIYCTRDREFYNDQKRDNLV